jgi:AcrR family transcriptional regulator
MPIYDHFAQKEDIVRALISDREHQLREAFEPRPDDPADFVGALRARSDRVTHLAREHRHFHLFALYEGIFESDLVPAESVCSPLHRADQVKFGTLIENR